MLRIVYQSNSWSGCQRFANLVNRQWLFSLKPHTFRVRTKRTHAYTRCTCTHIAVHYLTRFVVHLHLFLCIVIRSHLVYLWNDVVSQLMWKLIYSLNSTFFNKFFILFLKFLHRSCTCSARALIAGDMYFAYMTELIYRFQHHNHHDSSAIWISNDATRAV